jgi:hypothetical protein
MIEDLLTKDLIAHYQLPDTKITPLHLKNSYFELDDIDGQGLTQVSTGTGSAKFSNPKQLEITVIDYERFIDAINDPIFQKDRGRCDLFCTADDYFVLGEIKKRQQISTARKKAKKQLLASLKTLNEVPQIATFMSSKREKCCCFFYKKPSDIAPLSAVSAFNRVDTYTDGSEGEAPHITALGFKFYEYKSDNVFTFNDWI